MNKFLDEAYRQYSGEMVKFAMRYSRKGREDAEAFVHEAFTRALVGFHQFDTTTSISGWLFTILRNVVHDAGRASKRASAIMSEMPVHTFDDGDEEILEVPVPPNQLNHVMLLDALDTVKKKIADPMNQEMFLRYVSGETPQEIMVDYNLSADMVQSRVRRCFENIAPTRKTRENKKVVSNYDKEIEELYRQGLTDHRISKILGCAHSTVSRYRALNNLPSNGTFNTRKK